MGDSSTWLSYMGKRLHWSRVAPATLFIVEPPHTQVALTVQCGKTLVHMILCSGHKGDVTPSAFAILLAHQHNPF